MAAAIGDIVTHEYAALLKEYRVFQVTRDSYAAQWVAGAWRKAGIGYFKSELPKSQDLPGVFTAVRAWPGAPAQSPTSAARAAAIGAPHPSFRQGHRGSRPQRSR
jgi:hypothetical protein